MFDVSSAATNAVHFLGSSDKNEILVDDVDYDAFASGFSTVELDAHASDFDGWHGITSRASSFARSEFVI
jgi:hypothetical protein